MPTMLYATRGSLALWVGHAHHDPSDTEWNAYVSDMVAIATELGVVRILVLPGSGAPSPTQRQLISNSFASLPQRAAVVTNSIVAHGVTTVMRWLGGQIQAFSLDDRPNAYAHLSMTAQEHAWVAIMEAKLSARLSVKTIQPTARVQ